MAVFYTECEILGFGSSRSPLGIEDENEPDLYDGLCSRAVHHHRSMSPSTSSSPHFVGRVSILNQRSGNQYVPEFVSSAEMIRISLARRDRHHYQTAVSLGARPAGYTLSNLRIRFANLNEQWRRSANAYHFVGGTIFLDLDITVYVTEEVRNKPRCRDLIMSHEMMHVDDESTIVTHTLPARLPALPYISSDFRAPIVERDFNRRIRGSGDGHGSELEQAIQRNVWVHLSSNQAAELHRNHPGHGEEIRRCLGSQVN